MTLANDLVTVSVDPTDGTFSLNGVPGTGGWSTTATTATPTTTRRLEQDSVVDTPDSVSIAGGRARPVRAVATINAAYTWPDRVDDRTKSRVGGHSIPVVTTVELRADDRWSVSTPGSSTRPGTTACGCICPCPRRQPASRAECAFTVVERGLTAEGRPSEAGIPTFPSRRFVTAGGLTVVHEGLLEYELVDIEGAPGRTAPGRAHGLPPWRSPCCGPRGCCPGWA